MIKIDKLPTVKDVAKLAGVAPSTVSLVLNNSLKVTEETRQKVLKAVRALNYIPNNFAVSLRQSKNLCMGVLVPDINNPFYWKIVKGIKDSANEHQIPIYVSETKYDLEKEKHELDFLRSSRVNAYIFIGTEADEELVAEVFNSEKTNTVFIDKYDETGQIPYIIMDNYQSAYEATKYLIHNGRKNICYMTQNVITRPLEERKQGVLDALRDTDLHQETQVIQICDLYLGKIEAGYSATSTLFKQELPDAIITSSDQIAFGVIRRLYERGINVPEDISVIGFDNIDISQYSIPALTTVNQPCEQMGQLAFDILLECTKGGGVTQLCYQLKQDFIIRESVTPLKGRINK